MSNTYLNNPIKILHRLREAGFTQQQAEAQVEIITDYVEHGIATKKDLRELELKLEVKLKELELRLTLKTAAITSSIVGFFYLLEKFF
jgi:hypothetical protein